MNLDEFLEAVQELIDTFEDELLESVRRHQRRVLRRIIGILEGITTRNDGSIRNGRENRLRLNSIRRVLSGAALHEKYIADVEKFTNAFASLEKLHAEYYGSVFDTYPALIVQDIQQAARERAIQTMTINALNVGLQQPIELVLDQYLSGGRLLDLKETFRNRIVTQFREKEGVLSVEQAGYLESNSGRYVRNALNRYTRSIDSAIGNATNAKWYRFTGGRVDDTRDWCLQRVKSEGTHEGANGYYTIKEIREKWAKEKWQGRDKDTNESNIIELLGGHNCRHKLIPVSESVVPQSAKDRAKRLGYYDE